ncbi:MAG: hypothetical protein KAJ73_00725 [Zetaproteobacteria bacterium]|nr:hypothetical protein [Zetaproteobacteria bacterium]
MLYTKQVYPQVVDGNPHIRPALPASFGNIHEFSVTWDITSASEDDRAEYWEDSEGTLTAAQVEEAVYGAEGKAAWVTANPSPDI